MKPLRTLLLAVIAAFASATFAQAATPPDLAAYDRHATATGVTDGHVTLQDPTRAEITGSVAYLILPALSTYKERGQPLAEEAQITVLLRKVGPAWKMTAWTWTGVVPHPAP